MLSLEQIQSFYETADPVHDFTHVMRVVNMAERLAEMEGADRQIVRMAALLHDISRPGDDNHTQGFVFQTDEETDHALLAAQQARRLLIGEPSDFVDAVAHAIEAHRFRSRVAPQTLEAKVVFDADKLDAIGAIGIARAFSFSGAHAMPVWGDVSPDYEPGKSSERHTALHEFHIKLRHIKDRLYTDSGKRIAEARHTFMATFIDQINAEVGGSR